MVFHVHRTVLSGLQAGYRLIDTAKVYGNEPGIGQAVRESGIPRKEIFVTTKLWTNDLGYDSTLRAFDKSLERLGLEYIDLYLIHWPGNEPARRRESWQALEEVYKSGRVKAIGVSNYMLGHLEELLGYAKITPAVNQIEFHPFVYDDQAPILEACHEQGIVVEAYSPLGHGRHMREPQVQKIAKAGGKTTAQIMLRWAIQHHAVPIPKTSHLERMRENLDIFDFELSAEDMDVLDALSRGDHIL